MSLLCSAVALGATTLRLISPLSYLSISRHTYKVGHRCACSSMVIPAAIWFGLRCKYAKRLYGLEAGAIG